MPFAVYWNCGTEDTRVAWTYAGIAAAGWAAGVFLEWLLHWIMHRWSLGFHLAHHKEFFQIEPRQVALNTIDPRLDLKFFALALVALTPLMYWTGWIPVLLFWGGVFWHVVIVYELCHALIHYDRWLPEFFTRARPYRWWKRCHLEHHYHSPVGNYCITFPVLDWVLGTYVAPREGYEHYPVPENSAGSAPVSH